MRHAALSDSDTGAAAGGSLVLVPCHPLSRSPCLPLPRSLPPLPPTPASSYAPRRVSTSVTPDTCIDTPPQTLRHTSSSTHTTTQPYTESLMNRHPIIHRMIGTVFYKWDGQAVSSLRGKISFSNFLASLSCNYCTTFGYALAKRVFRI